MFTDEIIKSRENKKDDINLDLAVNTVFNNSSLSDSNMCHSNIGHSRNNSNNIPSFNLKKDFVVDFGKDFIDSDYNSSNQNRDKDNNQDNFNFHTNFLNSDNNDNQHQYFDEDNVYNVFRQ